MTAKAHDIAEFLLAGRSLENARRTLKPHLCVYYDRRCPYAKGDAPRRGDVSEHYYECEKLGGKVWAENPKCTMDDWEEVGLKIKVS